MDALMMILSVGLALATGLFAASAAMNGLLRLVHHISRARLTDTPAAAAEPILLP
jgi:hypothetical protein